VLDLHHSNAVPHRLCRLRARRGGRDLHVLLLLGTLRGLLPCGLSRLLLLRLRRLLRLPGLSRLLSRLRRLLLGLCGFLLLRLRGLLLLREDDGRRQGDREAHDRRAENTSVADTFDDHRCALL